VDNTDFDFRGNFNLDKLMCEHSSYNNLNYIQYTADMCDICLLEKIVVFRVAINYPVNKSKDKLESEEIAYSATVLLIACSTLTMCSQIPSNAK